MNRFFFLGLIGLAVLGGCKQDDTFTTHGGGSGTGTPIQRADITYAELARRYNEKIESFDSLWARTKIEIAWAEVDKEGNKQSRNESGDGKIMLRQPNDTAMVVEKVGKILLWAGSNEQYYWLFDLVDGDNKTVYVGAFDKLDAPGRRAFPLPVRPDAVPLLLGVTPLPTADTLEVVPPVDLINGQYMIELPGQRLLISRRNYRPTRVDLTDAKGFSVLTCKLDGDFPVEVEGVESNRLPIICDKADVFVSGYESRLTIKFVFATADPRRVRDTFFSLDALDKGLKPDRLEWLDQRTTVDP